MTYENAVFTQFSGPNFGVAFERDLRAVLRPAPRIRLAIARVSATAACTYKAWDQIKGVSVGGRAKRVTTMEEMAKVGALMAAKFPQLGDFVQSTSPQDMAVFRIEPEMISILDYTQGFGHTETAAP